MEAYMTRLMAGAHLSKQDWITLITDSTPETDKKSLKPPGRYGNAIMAVTSTFVA